MLFRSDFRSRLPLTSNGVCTGKGQCHRLLQVGIGGGGALTVPALMRPKPVLASGASVRIGVAAAIMLAS